MGRYEDALRASRRNGCGRWSLRAREGAIGQAAQAIAFNGLSRAVVGSSLHPQQRNNEAMIERVRAMGGRLGGEVFRRQSMLERPGDLARELQQRIPCATLAVVEGSGHMLPVEAPQRLLAVLLPWLDAVGKDCPPGAA